jgi:hypothetical protein
VGRLGDHAQDDRREQHRYISLSFAVVARKTGALVRRRYTSNRIPTTVSTPAAVPPYSENRWYACSEIPSPSVHDIGTNRPTTCPAGTNRMP